MTTTPDLAIGAVKRTWVVLIAALLAVVAPAMAYAIAAEAEDAAVEAQEPDDRADAQDAEADDAGETEDAGAVEPGDASRSGDEPAVRALTWSVVAADQAVVDTTWELTDRDGRTLTVVDDVDHGLADDEVADTDSDAGTLLVEGLALGAWTLELAAAPVDVEATDEIRELTLSEGDEPRELDDVVLELAEAGAAEAGASREAATEDAGQDEGVEDEADASEVEAATQDEAAERDAVEHDRESGTSSADEVVARADVAVGGMALPDHLGTGEFTAFEIDGDYAGPNDWGGGGYGPYTTEQGNPSTGTLEFIESSDACPDNGGGTDDGYTGQIEGVPFEWPVDDDKNVNAKDDLCEFGNALEIVEVAGEYHYVLYGYVARLARGTGDLSTFAILDVEGEVGDTLLEFDFNPSSGTGVRVRRWSGTSWATESISGTGLDTAVGPNPFVDGSRPDTYGEFAIDLTDFGLLPPASGGDERCTTFTVGGYATKTGNAVTANLEDRAVYDDTPVVSNCTQVEVTKESNVDTDAVFTYGLSQLDDGTVHDDTLEGTSSDGGSVTPIDSDVNLVSATITGGETHAWTNVIAGPDYAIEESAPPGWSLVDIECTWYDPFTGAVVTEVVNDGSGSPSPFQIPPSVSTDGTTTSCVMTNETSALVVEKEGSGDPGAVFGFSIDGGPAANAPTLSLGESTEAFTYEPGTPLTITETTLPDGSPGWVYEGAECVSDEDGAEPVQFPVGTPVEVETVGGQVITCTFSNTQQGQINVTKTGEPIDFEGDFGFDTDIDDGDLDGATDFSLAIDGAPYASGDIEPGTYTVVELLDEANASVDPGFVLDDLACEVTTTGSGGSSATVILDDATAVVDLAAGDIVDCTFTNVQAGRLIVEKVTDGADDTFTFAGIIAGSITTTDGVTADGDELVLDLPPGVHDGVAEVVPPGWDLVNAECVGDSGTTGTFVPGENEGGVDGVVVAAGETVTCTFTNERETAELTLTKDWVNAVDGDAVDLAASGSSGTEVDATGVSIAPDSGSDAVLTVYPGDDVDLSEVHDPANTASYDATLSCTDGAGLAYTDGDLSGTYTVPDDDPVDVTCTFTNTALRGNIVIVKNVQGTDGTFDFAGDWPDPGAGDISLVGDFQITTVGGTGSASWSGVLVTPDGEPYTVTELDPTPEYDGTDLVCVDPDGETAVDGLVGTIDLDASETVTCTYTNAQRSTITIVKDAVPDDDQAFTFTTSGEPLPASFALVDDGTDTTNTFTSDLLPAAGTYSVAETPVAGWTPSGATCDNGDSPDAIEPAAGQNVTCTFVNEAAPGTVLVDKEVVGVAPGFTWSFDIAIDPVDAGVTSPQAVTDADPLAEFEPLTLNETYTIVEPTLPAGWVQASIQCNGGDVDPATNGYQVTITEPGQVISCLIANEAQPSELIAVKQVAGVADDLAWAFNFSISPTTDGELPTQVIAGEGNGVGDNEATWENLVPGETYVLSETAQAGFDAGELTCQGVTDQDQDPQTVTFVAPLDTEAGYEVTCEATNTAFPSAVEVEKSVAGVADDLDWGFDVTIDPAPTGQDATETTSGSGNGPADVVAAWFALVPGETYTITEAAVDGYDAGAMACSGVDDIDGDPGDASVTFVAPSGSEDVVLEVSCSITNTARPSQVQVTKIVTGVAPEDSQWDFTFTIDPVPDGEQPSKEAIGAGDSTATVGWDGLVPGETYTIVETSLDGYEAGPLICLGSEDLDDVLESVTFVAPLDVPDGVEVNCLIRNTARPGTLTVTKSAVGGDGSFEFALTPEGVDPITYAVDTTDGEGVLEIDDLVPGVTYTFSEVAPGSSWVAGDLSCEVTHVDQTTEVIDFEAGYAVEIEDEIACAITNTATGTIVVVKDVIGLDATFDFTGDWPDGTPALVDGGFTVTTTDGTGSATFAEVTPGSYTVAEADPSPDYLAEALSCVDGDEGGTASGVDGLAGVVELDPGETVVCTFANTETATVVVDKVTDPSGDPTAFDFQFGPLDGDATDFQMADTDAPQVFGGLAPGDYLVDELVPEGWELTDVTCSPEQFVDGSQATVTVAAGDTVTCTWTNSGRGDLAVDKTATGVVDNGDGTQTVTYDLEVTTESAVAEDYEVTDELLFGDGIGIVSATVRSGDGTVNADWDGITDLDVTEGPQTLAPGATATYQVEVVVELTGEVTDTAADCELGEDEAGTGLLNTATVTFEPGESTDDDCEEVPPPDLPPTEPPLPPLPPRQPTTPPELPRTGLELPWMVTLASLLLAAGVGVRDLGRDRRRRRTD